PLRIALQKREKVDQDAGRVVLDFIGDGSTMPAVLDLDPEQAVAYPVAGDQHVVALANIDCGIERSASNDISEHQSVPGEHREEAVDEIALGPVVDDGESVHTGEVDAVDGEAADREAADGKAGQDRGRLLMITGRILVVTGGSCWQG